MKDLSHKEFFQFILNQFLAIDKDLIPWKLTCSYCYNYPHNIHIKYIDTKKCKNVLENTKIVEIDTNLYLERTYVYFHKQCDCGLGDHIKTSFDIDFLDQDLPYLKTLKLSFMNHSSDLKMGSILSKLTSLTYLDLGINTHVPDYSFRRLKNLKVLYIRNNSNTAGIFHYLPNLHTIQIGYDVDSNICYIKPKHIPDYVSNIIQIGYSYECPINGWEARDGCEPMYQHETYSTIVRPEKN